MAGGGRGTGLPGVGSGAVTPLVDLSSMGAAERVAAEGFGAVAQGIESLHRQILSPLLEEQGKQEAAQAVADGRFEQRDQITEYGQAYNRVMIEGTRAQFARDDDAFLSRVAAETVGQPQAFAARAAAYRQEQLERRPGSMAMSWTPVFDNRRNELETNLATDQIQRDARESAASLLSRRDELVARIARNAELGMAYSDTDPRFQADAAELNDIWGEIADNPLLSVSPEMADRAKQEAIDSFGAAAFAGLVRRAVREQGQGSALDLITAALPPLGEDGEGLPVFVTPTAGAQPAGLVQRGTVDLTSRPQVVNPDGTVSTVRSITVEQDGRFILLPTVSDDGRILTDGEALAAYNESGRQLGVFDSQANADAYAETLHQDQASGNTGAPMFTGRARELALQAARAAYAEETGLAEQRSNVEAASRRAAVVTAEALLESMRYGATVDPAQLRALAVTSGDPALSAKVEWVLVHGALPPEGYGGGGGGNGGGSDFDGDSSAAPGFQAAVDFVIDDIEGGDAFVANDNGRGPTRFGINATANPDLNIQTLTRAGAERRYRERYWNAIDGDSLPPALALVAFDAAVNQGPDNARRWIEESGGDVERLLALREEHYRSLARQDADHAANLPGWLNRLERVRARAGRVSAFSNTVEGFATDPINYALGGTGRPALARVAQLPLDGVFSPDAGQHLGWLNAVRARYATGEQLASQYQVPRRVFANGEIATYAARFRDDPTSVIPFAEGLVAALGGRKAREVLAEVGQGSGAEAIIHIADLATGGGDRRFAQQAAIGLQHQRTQGGPRLSTDMRDDLQRELAPYRGTVGRSPAFLAAVSNAATAAALADEAAGEIRPASYYVQAALGRTQWSGRSYGGAGAVNGQTTIFPRWTTKGSSAMPTRSPA